MTRYDIAQFGSTLMGHTSETIYNFVMLCHAMCRRAEKSCKVLMMMKAAKLGWAGAGRIRARRGRSWQGRSRAKVGTGQEQGRSR